MTGQSRLAPHCLHQADCGGCYDRTWTPQAEQQFKEDLVRTAVGEDFLSRAPAWSYLTPAPSGADRLRLEFQIRGQEMGLLHRRNTSQVVDLKTCELALPELKEWFHEARAKLPELPLASCRIRVSPQGHRGIWLDLPNETAKSLLEDPQALQPLVKSADVVELGQKRKAVTWEPEKRRFRLKKDPVFRPWSQSQWKGETIDLYSCVGDFTQPGREGNRRIVSEIGEMLSGAENVLEFGSGNGNLSFPTLSFCKQLLCIERVERLGLGFQESLVQAQARFPELKTKQISVRSQFLTDQSIQKMRTENASEWHNDTLLLNPSREGANSLLNFLVHDRVRKIVMMSCYPESFARDAHLLEKMSFKIQKWILVNQFPYTKHIEILSLWGRNDS